MRNSINYELKKLESIGYDLLDPNAAVVEICNEPQYTPAPSPQLSNEDLDRFDTVSFAIPSEPATSSDINWSEELRSLEASLSNGCIWSFDEEQSNHVGAKIYNNLLRSAVDILNQQHPQKSVEEILAEFDSWAGTPMDILSPYGDIDFNHNIYEDSFEVSVPVSIISQNEEIIVKANIPWVKAERFGNVDQNPLQIDLKSVLSLLPVRVNSRKVRVSFDNGEFRLEAPRVDIEGDAKDNIKAQ